MLIGIPLLVAMILLATRLLAVRAKKSGRQASVASIVTINGIIVAIVASLLGGGYIGFQWYRHDTCVTRADGRNGYRAGQLRLFNGIDLATGTAHFTHDSLGIDPESGLPVISLRAGLDADSPPLDPKDCPTP